MSSSAKVFYIQSGESVDMMRMAFYAKDFFETTKLIPNHIRMSRTAYLQFLFSVGASYSQYLPLGPKYALHVMTAFGPLPVVPVNDEMLAPDGFIAVEDTEFDEQFEKIMLGDGTKK